jgi:MGT family glycosyltransferase
MHDDRRLDFLIATWEGGGNVPPAITLVQALVSAGHRVRVMCDLCSGPGIEAAGAEFIAWRRAPNCTDRSDAARLLRDWEAATPEDGFARLRDAIMFGPALAYAHDVAEELWRDRPDLIVGSDMLFGVMAGCESQRQPLALLATNLCLFPIAGIPPFGAGLLPARTDDDRRLHEEIATASRDMFNAGLPALNAARQKLGLDPLDEVLDQLRAAERILLATSREFDFQAVDLPDNIRYVGPLLGEPHWVAPPHLPRSDNDTRPIVLVAFSSTFQDQSHVIRRITDALAELPVQAVVTLGPGLAADWSGGGAASAIVCGSASHDALMRKARVVITHAGHGTVMRALTHRVPLLCMPMGRDQSDNTVRVVARGAGLSLPADAPVEAIAGAVRRLIGEPHFARAATRLGNAVAAETQPSSAVAELVAIASAHRRPTSVDRTPFGNHRPKVSA